MYHQFFWYFSLIFFKTINKTIGKINELKPNENIEAKGNELSNFQNRNKNKFGITVHKKPIFKTSNMYFLLFIPIKVLHNVLRLAFSGVVPTPSHYKYNKTFHSAADFP